MKKMKFVLSTVFVLSINSTMALAATCNSSLIARDLAKIQSLETSDETKEALIQEIKNSKTKQIIACSAAGKDISREEASFAINELENRRKTQINTIENQNSYSQKSLDVATMSTAGRYLYGSMQNNSASRINEINTWVDATITRIQKFTK